MIPKIQDNNAKVDKDMGNMMANKKNKKDWCLIVLRQTDKYKKVITLSA